MQILLCCIYMHVYIWFSQLLEDPKTLYHCFNAHRKKQGMVHENMKALFVPPSSHSGHLAAQALEV